MTSKDKVTCPVCGEEKSPHDVIPISAVNRNIFEFIKRECPQITSSDVICLSDLGSFRVKYVQELLERDKGEVTDIEKQVLKSLKDMELISRNVDVEFEEKLTFGERLADKIAVFGGSWKFISSFMGILVIWIVLNSVVLFWRTFDPYPFILLNLVLSCLAALQAPVIMMSQNRQEAKDRLRSRYDYQVNLKAELEIRQLHEKMDHLLLHQWQRLLEIQQIQMDMMEEMSGSTKGSG